MIICRTLSPCLLRAAVYPRHPIDIYHRRVSSVLLYLVSEPLFYETELDSAVLARTILDAADKPRHVGDRLATDIVTYF
jgi:hypothetical protein